MDYVVKIDTEITYSEEAPKSTAIHLTKGFLRGGFLYFPSGPAGLLHCKVRHGLHQILPATEGDDYALDGCVVPLNVGYFLDHAPYTVYVETWNESTGYPHTLTIGLFLDPVVAEAEKKKKVGLLSRLFGFGGQE